MPPIAPPIIAAFECVDADCCSGIGMGVFDCVAIVADIDAAMRDKAEEIV